MVYDLTIGIFIAVLFAEEMELMSEEGEMCEELEGMDFLE